MEDVSPGGTRERILKAAEVLFAERGYSGTRLHEIAHGVGVQKASLFHHFASKEDLYRAVLARGYGETQLLLQSALDTAGSPLDSLRALTDAYIDAVVAHPERTRILLRQSLGDAPPGPGRHDAQRILDMIEEFVGGWHQDMGGSPIDVHAMLVGVVGMVAFFFTSAPVLAPDWFSNPLDAANVERIKRLVASVIQNFLVAGAETPVPLPAAAVAT